MKKTALLLVAALLAGSLVGCNSSTDGSSAETSNSQTSSGESSTSDGSTARPVDWYLNLSWFSSVWGEDWVTAKIKENTGFEVNVIVPPAGGENQRLTTLIASGELPDIMTLDWGDVNISQMQQANMLHPINELADEYCPEFYDVADPTVLIWNEKEDGNVYGYNCYTTDPQTVEKNPRVFSNYSFWVREDIYNALGKPDMTTTEGFLQALRDAKEKYPDIIPMGMKPFSADGDENGNLSLCRELQDFLAIPYQTEDGKLYDRNTDPEYIRWLKMFRQATEEKLIPPDAYADNSDKIATNLQNGKYFCMLDQWTDYTGPVQIWAQANPDAAYVAVDGPTNQNGDAHTLSAGSPNGWLTSVFPTSGKNPDNAIDFLAYMISPEGSELVNAGIEGKTFVKNGDTYETTPEYQEMLDTDAGTAGTTTGVQNWGFFCNTAENVGYFDFTDDSTKAIRDWNKPYCTYVGAFEFTPFEANSPEALAQSNIFTLWDRALPQMLNAKSDEEFDQILEKYISDRAAAGWDTFVEARQKQLDENNAKIAKFPTAEDD